MSQDKENLLTVKKLGVSFPIYGGVLRHKTGEVKAIDGVSFRLLRGHTLSLVGESGSGKTTVGKAIANLLRSLSPDVELQGEILFHTNNQTVQLNGISRHLMKAYRSQIQMIFQDPYSSLNPRMTVREIVERPLRLHTKLGRSERLTCLYGILQRVGLPADSLGRYPHEFSGGQRQRIGIARALSTRPQLIIADEPVSSLDVSVQAQVINLMQELQEDYGLTYIFIAHDLSVVYHMSDTIAVMYRGKIVEIGEAEKVYKNPQHPYTRALLSAVPQPDPRGDRADRIHLQGDIPTTLAKPQGCVFYSRCPIAQADCRLHAPPLVKNEDRHVACPYASDYHRLTRSS